MSKFKCEVYVHMVWHTKEDRPILHGELERYVHRTIKDAARKLGLEPLAVNSAWDHTHGLFRWHPPVSLSDGAGEMKSRTTTGWIQRCKELGEWTEFGWQGGGSLYSVRPEDVSEVIEYIKNQKRNHSENRPDGIYSWQDE